ncbi:hypothetical protein [Burkholderia sp. BCC0419]|uniref:hypothetical protein n=1 Tax=Burkholderia sp. BCC0419 TaxID=486878 RepID=UPI0015885A65|nr:hypothetical protein [Burkholderia sp. BCC0419]
MTLAAKTGRYTCSNVSRPSRSARPSSRLPPWPPLIGALYPATDASGVRPQVAIDMRDEAAARLRQLVNAEDRIGAD